MDPRQLQWACRRGMLELDLILHDFLTEAYLALNSEDQKSFVRLLSCTDAELADWLLSGKTPQKDVEVIVACIRHHANRHL
jgi:antitoxin CptB